MADPEWSKGCTKSWSFVSTFEGVSDEHRYSRVDGDDTYVLVHREKGNPWRMSKSDFDMMCKIVKNLQPTW